MDENIDVNEYLSNLQEENKNKWENTRVTEQEKIDINRIYTKNPHWIKITGGVVAVYADMINSSEINISKYRHIDTRGRVFDIFTGALASVFINFGVIHLDIEGDGALGIWNGGNDRLKAFCAAVTFRTYVGNWLSKFVDQRISDIDTIGVRIGIDEAIAAVKYVGEAGINNKNLVWAGEPIPSAAKLCKIHQFTDDLGNYTEARSHITVSDRLYNHFTNIEEIMKTCGCPDGIKSELWEECNISEENKEQFNFEKYYVLENRWCSKHGSEYCEKILSNINKKDFSS